MTLESHIQKPDLGNRVVLIELDASSYGQGTLYWVSGNEGETTKAVNRGGQLYSPMALTLSGFEMSADGPLPRPTITLSDTQGIFTPIVVQYNAFVGCPIRRIITYDRFLDDGAEPDPAATHPIDEYLIDRRLRHKPGQFITWELRAVTDVADAMLPARQCLRDFCDQSYRRWNGSGFDTSDASCPYSGTAYFTAEDVPTTAANDVCGKRLSSCKKRFGSAALPFRGFPAMARVHARG